MVAHTPKRDLNTPIDENTLAGSKRIANFMDAIFAIGSDNVRGDNYRYIKQIKVRGGGKVIYHSDNILTAQIVMLFKLIYEI